MRLIQKIFINFYRKLKSSNSKGRSFKYRSAASPPQEAELAFKRPMKINKYLLNIVLVAGVVLLQVACGKHESRNFGFMDSSNSVQGTKAETEGDKLMEAINLGKEDDFLSGLEKGFDVDSLLSNGRTLLIHSVIQGRVRFVWKLLQKGANIAIKDVKGLTAIDHAQDNPKILNLIDDNKQKEGQELLITAADGDDAQAINNQLVNQVNPNFIHSSGETPLTRAILSKSLNSVKTLARWKDPEGINNTNNNYANAKGELPLKIATDMNATKIIKILKENGASLEVVGEKL